MTRRFSQVDVFTDSPYLGNPLAVVLDAEDLDDEQMRTLARWTNLSETTFVLPPTRPGADYRVRIFTCAGGGLELPFAGHPTLGSCHAWLEAGWQPGADVIVQECAAGLVEIRRDHGRLAFAAPPLIRSGPVEPALVARIAGMLNLDPAEVVDSQWVDNGPGWVALLLQSAERVLAIEPGRVDLDIGVVGPQADGSETDFEVRAFFPQAGHTTEDPVTGSLNASLAGWLLAGGRARAPYVAAQGTALGRRGRAHVSQDGSGRVWVGGGTVTCIAGQIEL